LIAKSVLAVTAEIIHHPARYLALRWNWKGALLGSCVRSALFLKATWSAGAPAAASSSGAEFLLAFAFAGFNGALAQAYRLAAPRWLANTVAATLPPLLWHSAEFALHTLRGTPHLRKGMAFSISYSVLASLTSVTLMRHGAFLAGDEATSLQHDVRTVKELLLRFLRSARRVAVP
jgi:hypothetical protein